jgi:hypothetical protein
VRFVCNSISDAILDQKMQLELEGKTLKYVVLTLVEFEELKAEVPSVYDPSRIDILGKLDGTELLTVAMHKRRLANGSD